MGIIARGVRPGRGSGRVGRYREMGRELRTKVDWVRARLASASLALLAYVLV